MESKLRRNSKGKLTRHHPKPRKTYKPKPCEKCGFRHPRKSPQCGFKTVTEWRVFRRGQHDAAEMLKNLLGSKP